jgi:hydrogenase small subunit
MFDANLLSAGLSRRDFMKAITTLTAVMGLPAAMVPKVAQAAEGDDNRLPVIWLHFQECTGCSESILRSGHPDTASILLDIINLEYQETLMPGAGLQAEHALEAAMAAHAGKYILVLEGAVPLAENGIYCKVGGVTAKDSLEKAAAGAAAIVSLGTCATLGGVQAAEPNPTGAVSCTSLVNDHPAVINMPGCPPNPYNLPALILYIMTMGGLPELDAKGRPKFAYGRTIHDHCERRSHFDAGRFAKAFGDETHALGYCLYELGCKGPATYANCSTLRFNDGVAWPVSIGHPCIGCTEEHIFNTTIDYKVPIVDPASPSWFPPTEAKPQGKPMEAIGALAVGAVAGAALGYAAGKGKHLPEDKKEQK